MKLAGMRVFTTGTITADFKNKKYNLLLCRIYVAKLD